MGLSDIADGISRALDDAQGGFTELFEPVVRLGVTGLSRAGKTVFITSLVANLMDRARMQQLVAQSEGRINAAFLQPQPQDTVPRFDYESHLAALTGPNPFWPQSTRSVSQLRLSLKVQPTGLLAGVTGPRTLHLDIVDYPGEYLLDLPLLNQSYAEWSDAAREQANAKGRQALAEPWLRETAGFDASVDLDEPKAKELAEAYTSYLQACREAGFSGCAPGRFLLPGDLAGSPALTFAPLPRPEKARRGSIYAAFERRFESYKAQVVKPFFREHFARIDRQIVLVDALGAIHAGPQAVEDMRATMAEILKSFRPGRNSWLASILGKRVERILFAATKADQLHHSQHPQLIAILNAMMREARDRADFRGADTQAMAIASLRSTVEQDVPRSGGLLPCVRGRLQSGKEAALFPGDLPADPAHLLNPARAGHEAWLDAQFELMDFAPPVLSRRPGEGLPHIRLDKAAEFLIGDRL